MSASWVWSLLYFAGMLLAFIGERVVGAGTARGVTTGLGIALAAVAREPKLEGARVRDAVWSGIGLAGAVVFAFALAYVGAERDKKADLSYFRTARPGESTRKLVATMDQPVQVAIFFPPAND